MDKLKKTGISIFGIGLLLFIFSISDLMGMKTWPVPITVSGLLVGVVSVFFGPTLFVLALSKEVQNKVKNFSFVFSFFLIIVGILSARNEIVGSAEEVIIGTLMFCFFYGTLAFKSKFDKWKLYARTKYDALFLSLFDFLGVGAMALAFLFKIMHWPLSKELAIIGLSILIIGVLAWNQKFKKEVVFRKETEDKLMASLVQIETQHKALEEKQKEILDSIHYAKRIQKSMMPTEKYIHKNLNNIKNKS